MSSLVEVWMAVHGRAVVSVVVRGMEVTVGHYYDTSGSSYENPKL